MTGTKRDTQAVWREVKLDTTRRILLTGIVLGPLVINGFALRAQTKKLGRKLTCKGRMQELEYECSLRAASFYEALQKLERAGAAYEESFLALRTAVHEEQDADRGA
jgi:hypothetical protein